VSFRAEWSERSERNEVEEPRETTCGVDRAVPRLRYAQHFAAKCWASLRSE